MTTQDLSKDIVLAKKAAFKSGEFLLNKKDQINKRLNHDSKDIKLKADIESENLIKRIISTESKYPILAEESGKSSEDLGEIFWVIDPLDGTANYSRDIPICCVSIGLVKEMNSRTKLMALLVLYAEGYCMYKYYHSLVWYVE